MNKVCLLSSLARSVAFKEVKDIGLRVWLQRNWQKFVMECFVLECLINAKNLTSERFYKNDPSFSSSQNVVFII